MSKHSKRVRMACSTCGQTVALMLTPNCTPERECRQCEQNGKQGTMEFVDPWSPSDAEKEAHDEEIAAALTPPDPELALEEEAKELHPGDPAPEAT